MIQYIDLGFVEQEFDESVTWYWEQILIIFCNLHRLPSTYVVEANHIQLPQSKIAIKLISFFVGQKYTDALRT